MSCSSVKPDVSMSFLLGVMENERARHLEDVVDLMRGERREAVRNEEGRTFAMMKVVYANDRTVRGMLSMVQRDIALLHIKDVEDS